MAIVLNKTWRFTLILLDLYHKISISQQWEKSSCFFYLFYYCLKLYIFPGDQIISELIFIPADISLLHIWRKSLEPFLRTELQASKQMLFILVYDLHITNIYTLWLWEARKTEYWMVLLDFKELESLYTFFQLLVLINIGFYLRQIWRMGCLSQQATCNNSSSQRRRWQARSVRNNRSVLFLDVAWFCCSCASVNNNLKIVISVNKLTKICI